MNNGKMLALNDLSVWYTSGKPVLEKLSMELGANEVIGLIGLNGAGKTTFIKTLSGLLNTFQVRAVWWRGKPLLFRDQEFKKERYVAGTILFSSHILESICLFSFLRLLKVDAYVFYHPVSAKILIKHTKGTGSIFLYFLSIWR